ncbi:Serine/threonine-protein kinase [Ceratobasidium sp. AG-Ba]|nr:Serine/threonine-protein kinase [Ceratobasidium sp. AG-Ba]QRW08197.1 Serine/threonine-protein kinase [Ceratobasidium sp. AG-Ba]
MPATRLQRKRQHQEERIRNGLVHKLAPEVLSNIFIICGRLCEFDVEIPYKYRFPIVISAVCRQWRTIAIRTCELWSRITLDDPIPWTRSALYLARSGESAPLDIDIDMTESFWNLTEDGTTENCTERARDALNFIVSHGGVTSRWRSVVIGTDAFGPHRTVLDFLRSSPVPELRLLELQFNGPAEFDLDDETAMHRATAIKPLTLFKHPPSKLHSIKLGGVPNPFIFGKNQLCLQSLTSLSLVFVDDVPKLPDFKAVLQATTQLAVLRLDFDMVAPLKSHKSTFKSQIQLDHLRELEFSNVEDGLWPLNLLMMFKAPNLEYLNIHVAGSGCDKLLDYVAKGGNERSPQPLFPSITHLRIWLDANDYFAKPRLRSLLSAYPQITRLDIAFGPLDALTIHPWLVPSLKHLMVVGRRGAEVKRVVAARHKAGLPLEAVDFDDWSSHLMKPAERKYLESKVNLRFISFDGEDKEVDWDVEVGGEDPYNWYGIRRGLI